MSIMTSVDGNCPVLVWLPLFLEDGVIPWPKVPRGLLLLISQPAHFHCFLFSF